MKRPLDTDKEFRHALAFVANDLFGEAFAFAQIISAKWDDLWDAFQRYDERFRLIIRVLKVMEETVGLDFSDAIPYLNNSTSWSVGSIGGYTGAGGPKPHEVLTALYALASWVRHGESKFPLRDVRLAIKSVRKEHGPDAAVDYVLDLIDYGYIPYDDVASFFLGDILRHTSPKKWPFRSTPLANIGYAPYVEICRPQVIGRLLSLIDEAINSEGPDDFLLARFRMQRLTHCLLGLGLSVHRKKAPTAILPLISQIDEIVADSRATLLWFFGDWDGKGTPPALFSVGQGILSLTPDADTRARIQSSRGLLPRVLLDKEDDLPLEWREFPYLIISPVAAACDWELGQLPAKSVSADFREAPSAGSVEDLAHVQQAVSSSEDPDRVVLAVEEYPWAGALRIKLARSLLKAGCREEALNEARIGLHLEPSKQEAWDIFAAVLEQSGAVTEAKEARNIGRVVSD